MTTQDILYIVLAVSAAVLTAFLARLLYYVIAIVRDLRQTSRAIHDKVDEVGRILESIKERIGDSVSVLSLLTELLSKLVGGWKRRRAKRSAEEINE